MSEILLSDCVAYVESRNNPCAARYEPTWNATLEQIDMATFYATGGWISQNTAIMLASTSWGAYQIMGANLWTVCKYKGTLAQYLNTPSDQIETFKAFLGLIGWKDQPFAGMTSSELERFGAQYNGNGEAYADALTGAYRKLIH